MDIEQAVGQSEERERVVDRLSLDFKVGITLMMVVLAVAVVVLALTDSGGTKTKTTVVTRTVAGPALKREVAALSARIGTLAARLDRLSSGTTATAQLQNQLRALATQLQTMNQCLFQVQKELDDIHAYYGTKTPLRKRVSGPCLRVLQPRFAGR